MIPTCVAARESRKLRVMMTLLFSYLDPGAGSLLLQMILAGALGLSFTIKTYWKRIKGFFSRSEKDDGTVAEPRPTDDHR